MKKHSHKPPVTRLLELVTCHLTPVTRPSRLLLTLAVLLCSAGMAWAQTLVKGVVLSEEDHEPVVGASVRVEGASGSAVVTDVNGRFTLSVPEKSRLKISFLGMTS